MQKRRIRRPVISGKGAARATKIPGLRVLLPPEAGVETFGSAVKLGEARVAERRAERLAERETAKAFARSAVRERALGSELGALRREIVHFLNQSHTSGFAIKLGGETYSINVDANNRLLVWHKNSAVGDLKIFAKVVRAAAKQIGAKARK